MINHHDSCFTYIFHPPIFDGKIPCRASPGPGRSNGCRTQGVEEGVIGGLEARFLQLGLWGMIFQLFQPIGLETTTAFLRKKEVKTIRSG